MRLRPLLRTAPLAGVLLFGAPAATGDEGAAPAAAARRPNVLLVSVDALRADHVSFLGYGLPTTPRLDRLAERGFVFEEAHSSSSWTPPGAATFLTGLHPIRHGMVGGPVRLHEDAETLAEVLSDAGYRTRALVQNAWFAPEFGWARGFAEYRHHDFRGSPLCAAESEKDVIDWMARADERPWFLWLHHFAPHCPYEEHEPWASEHGPKEFSRWFRSVEFHEMERFKDRVLLPRDLERFVALYDGEVRFTDDHVGRVLDALEAGPEGRRTIVVLVSDHGEEFKDHGSLGHYRTLHREVTRVPFVIALPGQKRTLRFRDPVSLADLVPTLRAALGLPPTAGLDGESLIRPAAVDDPSAVETALGRFTAARDGRLVFSFRYAQAYEAFDALDRLRAQEGAPAAGPGRFANAFAVRDRRWTLTCRTGKLDLEASRAIDGTHDRAKEVPFLVLGLHYLYALFDRDADPSEQDDVAEANPEVCRRLAAALREEFRRAPTRLPFAKDGTVTKEQRVDVPADVEEALKGLGYTK